MYINNNFLNNNNLLDKFCEIMAITLATRSKEPATDIWPHPVFNPFIIIYFGSKELAYRLNRIFNFLEANNFSINDISSLFGYPSKIIHLMYNFMDDSSNENEAVLKTRVAYKLLEIINLLRNGNPFCEDGRNLIWNEERVAQEISNVNLINVSDSTNPFLIRRLISSIIVGLLGYIEFLYFCRPSYGKEFHGPYDTPLGKLMVREFFNLKPSFWHFSSTLSFEKIRLFTVYPNDMDLKFDVLGRIRTTDVLGSKLIYTSIIVDEKEISLEVDALQRLLSSIEESIQRAIQEVSQMDKYSLMSKFLEGDFWVLKPFMDILGEDWKPSEELYLRIKRKEEPYNWISDVMKNTRELPFSMRVQIFKKLFDPRIINKKNEIMRMVMRLNGF
ncbi:hypothetical protein D6D85_03705 [Candidatus Methanodesulfokora washburnensis]|uniref:Uncharacterized protein n=2 Tax=Candidatus Methanodesulfokora washburnensis TaxID=2478471 RepID=A0A3R9PLK3_9CREN|nr:hypothetical protein D6D85_03705 [Candidatus Methanodesulfokores washburnensis]